MPDEYLGPLCRHVCYCYTCGGCDRCCPGHNDAPAFSDDLADDPGMAAVQAGEESTDA